MCGNLLWRYPEDEQEKAELHALFERIKATGIWCSCFPEGDGFCFATNAAGNLNEDSLTPEYYKQATTLFQEVFGDDLLIKPV
jgi:hypothetical protein